jgi:hypothetical protein
MNRLGAHQPSTCPLVSFYLTAGPLVKSIFDRTHTVATHTLTQLVAAFAANLILLNHPQTRRVRPDNALFFTALTGLGIVAWTIGWVIRTLSIQLTWAACFPQNRGSPTWDTGLGHLARLSLINTLTLKLNHYIHEGGHAGAALLSFVQAKPVITANSIFGQTECTLTHGLTSFGKLLGKERAKLFVTASGLIVPILCAMAEFAAAHQLKHHSTWHQLLHYHGISQVAELLFYSLSALWASPDRLDHDCIRLWKMGNIHPLIPMTLMIALPLAEVIMLTHTTA